MTPAKKKDEAQVEEVEAPVSEAPIEAVAPADDAVAAPPADEVREPRASVTRGEVPAQVAPAREADSATVPVNEVYVTVDEVITDPNDPKAVQVPEPDANAGSLPIHALGGPRAEDVFAEEASKADKS